MGAMKDFYKSQSKDLYKTKADVLKEIWRVFAEKSGKKMPPLDEEFLAELEQIPAVDEISFRHPWGIADKLYKSEAIDAFGFKYLLGVFETIPEAQKAFEDWNGEFEQARTDMENELDQWSKQEQARLQSVGALVLWTIGFDRGPRSQILLPCAGLRRVLHGIRQQGFSSVAVFTIARWSSSSAMADRRNLRCTLCLGRYRAHP